MNTMMLALLVLVSAGGDEWRQPVPGSVGFSKQDPTIRSRETSSSFAVYLVTEPVDGRIIGYGRGDWSHVRLSPSPLISAEDIISYDFSMHSMRLRPEALSRIPKPPVKGTPFVVVAQGQRIYLGAFVSLVSSASFAVPSIVIDRHALDPARPKDTLVIERGYPSSSFGVGPDPRGDARIKAALMALHKLTSDR